jgi:hypothetical protein
MIKMDEKSLPFYQWPTETLIEKFTILTVTRVIFLNLYKKDEVFSIMLAAPDLNCRIADI